MKTWTRLLFGATALTSLALGAPAFAAGLDGTVNFQIAPGNLDDALMSYAKQSDLQVISASAAIRGKQTAGVEGASTPREALAMLLKDSGLHFVATGDNTVTVTADPQSGSAAGDGADAGTVAALIVTAQKKEEQIQDVPIAISAFTEKSLEEQKIEGGFDLLKAIPNVTFSKNNFSSYNFSIRGIGTKAVSVTTDPGVAVAFNSTSLIRNRLFEQEYFDIERVEVLRGPQGTLYGRNATAGVINVISAKPNLSEFAGWLKGEVGNYHTKRASAMINVPLVEGKLAIRFAGSLTDRQGYDYNATTKNHVNGRDLWSARVTVGFNPTDRLRSNLVWERFNEDDNRSRTGKQLCHRDPGPTHLGNLDFTNDPLRQAFFSQGCKPGSLYNDDAFGTPNGLSIPFVAVATSPAPGETPIINLGTDPQTGLGVAPLKRVDPYGGMMQSRDLRIINSVRDPRYRAKADIVELNVDFDVLPNLSLTSQTAYDGDRVYSFQDYNRFNTVPVFSDTSKLEDIGFPYPSFKNFLPGGIYCDPQIGCSNSIAGFDISQAKSEQFSQEFRVQSSFAGNLNFSAGGNYTRYRTVEDYYVMYNLITMLAQVPGLLGAFNGSPDYTKCIAKPSFPFLGFVGETQVPPFTEVNLSDPALSVGCIYIDPNPVESINGEGHNYFRSKNPYKLKSYSAFGEVYWQATPDLKVTAGLRYTDDRKIFTPVPSQVLLSTWIVGGGFADRGYPEFPDIKQRWGEVTGRVGIDRQLALPFTNKTMLYAFYSRGYKGGGANPPGIGYRSDGCFGGCAKPLTYPALFKPEFVNAYELGAKNTLLGGGATLNGDVFFYDYKDYQVSQIKERTAVNENFDAKVWGLELEGLWYASRDLRFNGTLGYMNSRIANGEQSIDLMDRIQGHAGYTIAKPWIQLASNCVTPISWATGPGLVGALTTLCPGSSTTVSVDGVDVPIAVGPNGGAGFYADLGGNQLPNAPHWTISLGTQYGFDFLTGWRATIRGDAYWQSQSWARVYNDNPYDKLHGWYNVNLSAWIERPEDGLKIEIYAKNLLDKTPITDAFLNSDDTALTTNVFVLDPRLIGLSIKKDF